MALKVRSKWAKKHFLGKIGRYGFVEKTLWEDLTQDQLVEMWNNMSIESRQKHLIGHVEPNHVSKFAAPKLPVKKAAKKIEENTTK